MVVQRVADPDQVIVGTVRSAHAELYKAYKSLASTFPTPSQARKRIKGIVDDATSKDDAYESYATYVATECFNLNESETRAKKKEVLDLLRRKESSTKRATEERARTLEELRKTEKATDDGGERKKRRLNEEGEAVKTYSTEERELLKTKLADSTMKSKLYRASTRGYRRHRAKARLRVEKAAKANALTELGPLSTSDMAMAQDKYEHGGRIGDPLLLEQIGEHKVTMLRSGGQVIQQLGPYLPSGGSKSVQETIHEILENTGLSSKDLAEAINIPDDRDLVKWLKKKGVGNDYVVKIRAMRHLLAVEKDRGPEVALATSLEHRSALHGYRHIEDYPSKTPLGPSKATQEIRAGRTRALEKKGGEEPADFDYVPDYIDEQAMESTTHFVTNFLEAPALDPEAQKFITALMEEDLKSDDPSEMLVEATADVLRTPKYTGFGGEEEDEMKGVEDESKGPFGSGVVESGATEEVEMKSSED